VKVRTTITLEKEVLRRAKIEAAASDRSLSALIEDALRRAIERHEGVEPVSPFRVRVFKGQPGLAPGIRQEDFLSPWELIGRLERETRAPGNADS
jgi:hypothetical protein